MIPQEVKGFEIPIHSSLIQPILLAGVPRGIAILNGTVTSALIFGLHVWWIGIPVGIFIHIVARYFAKKDPYFFEIGKRHIWQPTYYDV